MPAKKLSDTGVQGDPAEIQAALEAYRERMSMATAPAWRPEPGQTLHGEVIQLRMGESGYGPYPIIVVREYATGSTFAVHAFHTLVRSRLAELGVKIGFNLVLSYLGTKVKNDAADKDESNLEKTDSYHMYYAEDGSKLLNTTEVEEGFSFE